jgi:hypothetical protein
VLVGGGSFSLGLAFYIMTSGVPIANLENIFISGAAISDAPWIGNFISSIHNVYYLSMAFCLLGIVPSVLRGTSPGHKKLEEDPSAKAPLQPE